MKNQRSQQTPIIQLIHKIHRILQIILFNTKEGNEKNEYIIICSTIYNRNWNWGLCQIAIYRIPRNIKIMKKDVTNIERGQAKNFKKNNKNII